MSAGKTLYVELVGNATSLVASAEKGSASLKGLAASAAAAGDAYSASLAKAEASSRGYTMVGKGLLAVGATIGAGFGIAIKAATSFDQKMALVQSLSRAAPAQMAQLRNAALTAGQAYGYTADQVADAEAELVKAGISIHDIMGGALTGVLTLAAAGQMDVAQATQIAAVAMTQFKLKGQDVPHIADLLAAGADRALGSVQDLGEALTYGGSAAAQAGWSLDETVGTLAELAQGGQMGSKAGMELQQMLRNLQAPSQAAQAEIKNLGLQLYDANGNFISTTRLAGELHDKLGALPEAQRNVAIATLFTSHAVRAANVLMSDGAQVNAKWISTVDDQGFAAAQAAGKLDSLSGDWQKFTAAVNSNLIEVGQNAQGPVRSLVQDATGIVETWGQLPGPVKDVAEVLAAAAGSASLFAGAALVLGPRLAALRAALTETTVTAEGTETALSGLGKASAVVAGLMLIYEAADKLKNALEPAAPSVDRMTTALVTFAETGKNGGQMLATFGKDLDTFRSSIKELVDPSLMQKAEGWSSWDPLNWVTGTHADLEKVDETKKALSSLDQALANMVTSGRGDQAAEVFHYFSQQAEKAGVSSAGFAKELPKYGAALDQVQAQAKLTGQTVDQFGQSMDKSAQSAAEATRELQRYENQLHAMADPVFAVISAQQDLAQKQTAAAEAAKKYGANSSEARKANVDLAQSALGLNDAEAKLAAQLAKGGDKAHAMRGELAEWVKQGYITQAQADQLTGKIDTLVGHAEKLNKTDFHFTVKGDTTEAQQQVTTLESLLNLLHDKTVTVTTKSLAITSTGHVAGRATGGGLPEGWAAVGEEGPELVHKTGGSVQVFSNSMSRAIVSATGMQAPGFAEGTLPGAGKYLGRVVTQGNVMGLLAQVATGGGAQAMQNAADSITALDNAWQQTIQAMQDASQRTDLVNALAKAKRQLDAAKNETVTKSRTGKDIAGDISQATQAYHQAKQALSQFDEQQKQSRITSRLAAVEAREAAKEDLQANKEAWQFDNMSTAQQVANLTKRMKALKRYSDQWLQLAEQRKQLQEQLASGSTDDTASNELSYQIGLMTPGQAAAYWAAQMAGLKKYSDAWMTAQQNWQSAVSTLSDDETSALSNLNDLLSQRASILSDEASAQQTYADSIASATTSYQQQVASILSQRQQAIEQFNADDVMSALINTDQAGAEKTLTDLGLLTDAMKAYDDQATSITATTQSIEQETTAIQQWSAGLAELRQKGLSQDAISALGLDTSPASLAQVQAFASATTDQISQLNQAIADKMAAAGQEVSTEQTNMYGDVGSQLLDAQTQFNASVADAWSTLQDQLQSDQSQLDALGEDTGLSLTDAIAAGLMSGIPGILAAAQAVQAAAASAAVGSGTSATSVPTLTSGTASAVQAAGGTVTASQVATLVSKIPTYTAAQISKMTKKELAQLHSHPYAEVFDSGVNKGPLKPGKAGVNLSGSDEWVFTIPQIRQFATGVAGAAGGRGVGDVHIQIDARGAQAGVADQISQALESWTADFTRAVGAGTGRSG